MNVADLFRAFLSLGLPVAALSWVLFSWIFSSGEIGRSEKRAAIKKQVKKLRSLDGLRGKTGRKLVFDKWVNLAPAFMVWLVSGH
jgi:lipopolysaccharide export LptBFGC system permease protein LptF